MVISQIRADPRSGGRAIDLATSATVSTGTDRDVVEIGRNIVFTTLDAGNTSAEVVRHHHINLRSVLAQLFSQRPAIPTPGPRLVGPDRVDAIASDELLYHHDR